MLLYNLKLAFISLRRTPLLSILVVAGIGLGIGISIAFIAVRHLFTQDPVPTRSDVLHYVRVDGWDPENDWPGNGGPEAPPAAMTYRDAMALLECPIPVRQTALFPANLFVHPVNEDEQPFKARTRLCYGDFFAMMDVPFQHGGPWDAGADEAAEAVVVIDDELNQRLFGGQDSTGESLRIEDRTFTVVGVLAPWKPPLRFYEMVNSPVGPLEAVFFPFQLGIQMKVDNAGNDYGWGSGGGNGYEAFLASESCWLGFWAELETPADHAAYAAWLDAYALEQKALGRFQRPLNNRVTPVRKMLDEFGVLPDEVAIMSIVSLLFLLLAVVNVIGLLLGKFMARANESGTRRAMGASRMAIFVQHIVECEVIGVAGGLLGLGIGWALLQWINGLQAQSVQFELDGSMLLVAAFLALVAGFVAGVYPAWRICSMKPAVYLKQS